MAFPAPGQASQRPRVARVILHLEVGLPKRGHGRHPPPVPPGL